MTSVHVCRCREGGHRVPGRRTVTRREEELERPEAREQQREESGGPEEPGGGEDLTSEQRGRLSGRGAPSRGPPSPGPRPLVLCPAAAALHLSFRGALHHPPGLWGGQTPAYLPSSCGQGRAPGRAVSRSAPPRPGRAPGWDSCLLWERSWWRQLIASAGAGVLSPAPTLSSPGPHPPPGEGQ